jgi:uncharacterized delta-60 repeat protein
VKSIYLAQIHSIMKKRLLVVIITILSANVFGQTPTSIDPSFVLPNLSNQAFSNRVTYTAVQSDGKLIVGGYFISYKNLQDYKGIVRLNPDGTQDATFQPPNFGNKIWAIVMLPNDKILVSGDFNMSGFGSVKSLIRLNADGSIDNTFLGNNALNLPVHTIALQPDGKILIGGVFSTYTSNFVATGAQKILRLNTDGSIDSSFSSGSGFNGTSVNKIILQPDGKIVVAGKFTTYNSVPANNIIRLLSNGSVDNGFLSGAAVGGIPNAEAYAIALQSDNKILIGGRFNSYDNNTSKNIARLNTNGTFDNTFISGTGFNNHVYEIAVLPNDKIYISGGFTTFNDITATHLIRLEPDGSNDVAFNIGTGFNSDTDNLRLLPGGKILVGGSFSKFNDRFISNLVQINPDGTRDTTFNSGTGNFTFIESVNVLADNKYLLCGRLGSYFNDTVDNTTLAKLNSDGTVDPTFTNHVQFTSTYRCMEVAADGKILIAGSIVIDGNSPTSMARFNSDGTPDGTFQVGTGFKDNGNLFDTFYKCVLPLPNGKILVGGRFTSYNENLAPCLVRLNNDGSYDNTFVPALGSINNMQLSKILLLPDNEILVADTGNLKLYKFNSDGSAVTSFNTYTSNFVINDIALQTDGKILISENAGSLGGAMIKRLNVDGTLDNTFSAEASLGYINDIIVQPDGKILCGGTHSFSFTDATVKGLTRLNADGSLDESFVSRFNLEVNDIALQADGKIVAVGQFTLYSDTLIPNDYTTTDLMVRLQGSAILDTHDFSENNNKLVIYPNPASDYILINNAANSASNYTIYDMFGKKLQHGNVSENRISVDRLQLGFYVILIQSGSQAVRAKFVKN